MAQLRLGRLRRCAQRLYKRKKGRNRKPLFAGRLEEESAFALFQARSLEIKLRLQGPCPTLFHSQFMNEFFLRPLLTIHFEIIIKWCH